MDKSDFSISISKDQLAAMPVMIFGGKISVISSPGLIRPAIELLRQQPLVGFDTETKPAFKKGQTHNVALMQVSGPDLCFLFRLNHTGITDEMAEWLADENCRKVGLSLRDDFHQLHKIKEFEPGGFIELQTLVRDYHITDSSLQKIYGILFGKRISKSQRLSNWEAQTLTDGQQAYAALDAWACLNIYNHLADGSFDPAASRFIVPQQEDEVSAPSGE